MLLDKFFVNLRTGAPGRFFASKVLNIYGRLFIGGPSLNEMPAEKTWQDDALDQLDNLEKRL
ncbi:hypothetical protein [Pseudoxanthomonas daejeonensis]|uniref:Uncharacterized protein n=1 Tax=Pseudoxanthomonas daejeonensis TaxID=266062 RepID=A0ABQ6ZA77_9GAMM|nr:hypothetical protein [Pseudoxanthomonas daejeonensis]KAF1696033.1 hypothetical protein CSC65_05920 [Pseudoxanthomonas daejeonensis]